MKAVKLSLTSDVLIIGSLEQRLFHTDAAYVSDLSEALQLVKTTPSYSVVILAFERKKILEIQKILSYLQGLSPKTQKILVGDDIGFEDLAFLMQDVEFFKILSTKDNVEEALQEAFEAFQAQKQDDELVELLKDSNSRLESLTQKFKKSYEKQKKQLMDLQKQKSKEVGLLDFQQSVLAKIHKASTEEGIENCLNKLFSNLLSVRIHRLSTKDVLKNQKEKLSYLTLSLEIEDEKLGEITFFKKKGQKFSSQESKLFREVSETVALALDRLDKMEQMTDVENQWDLAFKAVLHPFCLTNENFEIFEANDAFLKKTQKSLKQLLGKNALTSFFGFSPQIAFEHKKTFTTHVEAYRSKVYEIRAQKTSFDQEVGFIFLFRDVTEQRKLELQTLQSSKQAELGTISSSIAHELNNPLGAILSFVQLLQMQNKDDKLHMKEDLEAMAKAALKCQNIVQNLLEFVRNDTELKTSSASAWLSDFEKKSQFDSLKKNKIK